MKKRIITLTARTADDVKITVNSLMRFIVHNSVEYHTAEWE